MRRSWASTKAKNISGRGKGWLKITTGGGPDATPSGRERIAFYLAVIVAGLVSVLAAKGKREGVP